MMLKNYLDHNFLTVSGIQDAIKEQGDAVSLYREIIANYQVQNDKHVFNEYFDEDYVYGQLDAVKDARNDALSYVPVGVKDIFNTEVLPTAMGSILWKDFRPGNDARAVFNVKNHGGIVFSKTVTAEFAVHYLSETKTKNPHSAKHITGTSSSGSAVAVACGALPVALATQTAGSIIRPASFCGTIGFKPSFGCIARTGCLKTTDTLDTIGLIGNDMDDILKVFKAIKQGTNDYPLLARMDTEYAPKKKYRVGILTDQLGFYNAYHDEVKADFSAVAEKLSSLPDIEVVPVSDCDFLNDVHSVHETIYDKSLSYYFKSESKYTSMISDIMQVMIEKGNKISTPQYLAALEMQKTIKKKAAVLQQYDIILTPSTATPAPLMGETELKDSCLIWTFLGLPSMNLPVFASSEGLPFGLQIVANKYDDYHMFDFAKYIAKSLFQ